MAACAHDLRPKWKTPGLSDLPLRYGHKVLLTSARSKTYSRQIVISRHSDPFQSLPDDFLHAGLQLGFGGENVVRCGDLRKCTKQRIRMTLRITQDDRLTVDTNHQMGRQYVKRFFIKPPKHEFGQFASLRTILMRHGGLYDVWVGIRFLLRQEAS